MVEPNNNQNRIKIPYNFTPRDYQRPVLVALDKGYKRACCVWHRRSGKDKTFINHIAKEMFRRIGAYYYVFPTYKQGKKVIWQGMDRSGFKFTDHIPQSLRLRTDNSEMIIETMKPTGLMTPEERVRYKAGESIKGSLFQVVGSDNIDSIVGANPVGIVFSEWALQNPLAWDYLRPILAENNGFAIFDYTPRGKNHGYTLLQLAKANPDIWYSEVLTVDDTEAIPRDTLNQELKEIVAKNGNDALYQQEYMCNFNVPIQGAYYADQLITAESEGRITNIPIDVNQPVYTFWDLGIDDSMTIWFMQRVGKEFHFIDYYENSGEGINFYIGILQEKPYIYAKHYAPHDIRVRELTTGKSRLEISKRLGIDFEIVANIGLVDGINATRAILNQCWFDGERCEKGLSALRSYHKEWDEMNQVFKSKPSHDWSSHGADAFRMFAVGWQEEIKSMGAVDHSEQVAKELDPYD